ncbi:hypothetical protein Hanom_Chr12g01152451 [Helianthus anomalus]
MVKPDLDLWTGTVPIFKVVNRFCILCLISSRVGSGNSRVRSGFSFWSPLDPGRIKNNNSKLNYSYLLFFWLSLKHLSVSQNLSLKFHLYKNWFHLYKNIFLLSQNNPVYTFFLTQYQNVNKFFGQ